MLLTGHSGAVYSLQFHPSGQHLASASFDRRIYLWDVYGECDNYAALEGHKSAVLEVKWSSDGSKLFSASADQTCCVWDHETGQKLKRCRGHTGIVNSCAPGRQDGNEVVLSGSDDGFAKLWDLRARKPVMQRRFAGPVTGVALDNGSNEAFCSSLDNTISMWDLRKDGVGYVLEGHEELVTSVSLSPDGTHLLSNSADNTVKMWDVRPWVLGEDKGRRLVRSFSGIRHNVENMLLKCSWSADGKRVSAGSSDKLVYVWEAATGKLQYKLPGHSGSVNDVAFHPLEPIIGSASSDKSIYLGEISKM